MAHDIQTATILHKLQLVMAAMSEQLGDSDEALDVADRLPEPLEFQSGFTMVIPASLSYYVSTGTAPAILQRLIDRMEAAQADEWKRQHPGRPALFDCADTAHSDEADEWITSATQDETVWCRIECVLSRDHSTVTWRAAFTNEYNQLVEWPEFTLRQSAAEFLSMDDSAVRVLITTLCEAPYCSIVALCNSGGCWTAWFGNDRGPLQLPDRDYYMSSGHLDRDTAVNAVQRLMQS